MEVDYVIVGQGIAGTMLSYYLLQQGNTVIVVDEFNPNSASQVASGVINPVTGRRFVTTWMIETLMPFAQKAYQSLEKLLNVSIIQQTQLIDFHTTRQMQQAFQQRANDDNTYVSELTNTNHWQQYFQYAHGIGTIQPVFHIQLQTLLSTWRNYLQQQQILLPEVFSLQNLTLSSSSIAYRNIKAKAIIFCNGLQAMHLPYFNKLPFAPNKGEALILHLPNLPTQYLYKHGISLIPWQNNLWWAGSSYEWSYNNALPTQNFQQKTMQQLQQWLKMPFQLQQHIASERPATLERRPFVGMHPYFSQIGILNGFGTKGCSLAPYFAYALAQHLTNGYPILAEAAINRFQKILQP